MGIGIELGMGIGMGIGIGTGLGLAHIMIFGHTPVAGSTYLSSTLWSCAYLVRDRVGGRLGRYGWG